MRIDVKYSIDTEALRVYSAIMDILEGWYIRHHWYPVSVNSRFDSNATTVLMPDINYAKVLQKVIEIKHIELFDPTTLLKKETFRNLKKQIEEKNQFLPLSKTQITKFHEKQEEILTPALKKMKSTLTYLENSELRVTVIPTRFGTYGSFNLVKNIEKLDEVHVQMYMRMDQTDKNSLELLASALTRSSLEPLKNVTWRETEAISDFFTKHVLGYKNHIGTLDRVSKRNPTLLRASINFLTKHGLPTGEVFKYDPTNNKIFIVTDDVSDHLSPHEFRLLRTLIQNKNFTVTFDEISDALYNSSSYEKFSMWGITKTVQRVRDKLEVQGIPRNSILNVKGEGFKLII